METKPKKKILYFIPEFPRLSETFIIREIGKLAEFEEFDVRIFALAKGTGEISPNLEERIIYQTLTFRTELKALLKYLVRFAKVSEAFKLVMKDTTKSFMSRLYFYLKSLGYTYLFELQNPDHIHAHFLADPSTIAMVASVMLDIPFSVSGHARDVFVEGTLINEKAKYAKFITICNGYAFEKCLSNVDEKYQSKIHKIFHGIDIKLFESPSKLEKPELPVLFLGGTRLVEKKGITYIIKAAKLLRDMGVNHRVDLVGFGPLYESLLAEVREEGLDETVIFYGEGNGLPFSQVREYYNIADIFVFPSIETSEGDADGVPTVVIEAALAKLPIISTSAGGITDLVEDGVTGIIIPQRNSKAIAEKVKYLLDNPEEGKRLGENAYIKASKMFDLDVNISRLRDLFLM